MRAKWGIGLATLLLLALVACEDSTGVSGVDHIELGPSDQIVVVGDSVELLAVPRTAINYSSYGTSVFVVREKKQDPATPDVAPSAGDARLPSRPHP